MNTKYLFSSLTAISIVSFSPIARAQTYQPSNRIPVADSSRIGTQVVETTSKNFTITGGVNLGQNLLHSFTDFSIPTGGSATFNNSLGKPSIITRVTGRNFSDIDGLINTQGANFFLLNPNGIAFGKNTELNVGRFFVGSTATGIDLTDGGGNTSRFGVNGNDSPLLTINENALIVPARLILGGENGEIRNFGTLQTVNPNQYIGLIGGNVNLNGGKIEAPGGRVELGGLLAPGTVTLGVEGNNLRAEFPTNVGRGDVSLTNQARVNVAGAGGGDILIGARNVEILGGSSLRGGIETGFGVSESAAGDIKVNATGDIVARGGGVVNVVRLDSKGKGGNIIIDGDSFSLQEGAQLGALTVGQGNAGNVKVTAKNAVSLIGSDILSTVEAGGTGKGGNIDINSGSLSLRDGAQLLAITRGSASPTQLGGKGDAGNVNLQVTGVVDISGTRNGFGSGIRSNVETGTQGNAGNIIINAGSFSLRDSAQISTSTSGQGNAGNVKVSAKNTVFLAGAATIFSTVEPGGRGKGGNIDINAGSLSLRDGAQLLAITRGSASPTQLGGKGDAGNVNLQVTGVVDISGIRNGFSSGITTFVDTGTEGNGGNIDINAGSFSLRDGAKLSTATSGQGNAGNVKVSTKDTVLLTGGQTTILSTVEAGGTGKGGNIDINAGSLSLRDGAQLLTITRRSASLTQLAGRGNAGNVNVQVAGSVDIAGTKDRSPSGIRSNVETGTEGNAGDIIINAGSFSLRDGALLAAATLGKGNAGTIKIYATDYITVAGKSGTLTSGLFVNSQSLTGTAGDIIVNSPKITLDNSGTINATSVFGKGGNINIGGKLLSQSTSIQGSPINPADTKILSLRRGAQISTNASGTTQQGSNGGNITITAPNGFIVTAPNENSDISANGFSGSGGKVDIKTKQNFWISPLSRTELQQRLGPTDPNRLNPLNPFNLPTNDITAISQVNPNLSGQVSITPPQIDITAGLSPLPNSVTDPTNQINPNCSAKAIGNNSFTNVGRGGIPATPKDPLNEQEIATNWVRLNPQDTLPSTPLAATPAPATQLYTSAEGKPIVEAQAWRRERNGDIVLVAGSSLRTLPRQGQSPSGCVGQ